MKDKALTYMRNLGLIAQDKSEFVIRMHDGTEFEFVQILADFAQSHEGISGNSACPICHGAGLVRAGKLHGDIMPPVKRCDGCGGTGIKH